jgi:hypothetical protein
MLTPVRSTPNLFSAHAYDYNNRNLQVCKAFLVYDDQGAPITGAGGPVIFVSIPACRASSVIRIGN